MSTIHRDDPDQSKDDDNVDNEAIYQTLPMGSFFEEKVPFQFILIKNDS